MAEKKSELNEPFGDFIRDIDKLNSALDLSNANPLTQNSQEQFKSNGFLLPATFSADGNGLPYSKVPSHKPSQLRRNIITWFIPEFGIVRMYVNPSSISYNHKKIIQKEKTKGGYTLQYWGEELTTLNINGTTGSSGIEGINVLYEIYRAEQYAFDGVGLSLAAYNSNNGDIISNKIADSSPVTAALLNGITGSNANTNFANKNIPSLAQLAFTVEMYYNGWVYRGYFDSMTINEKANDFLIDYQMTFIATQRRGYRVNYFPWSRSAKDGPSQYQSATSFSGFSEKNQGR